MFRKSRRDDAPHITHTIMTLDSILVQSSGSIRLYLTAPCTPHQLPYLALELLGGVGELGEEGGKLVGSLRGEQHDELLELTAEDLRSSLLRELGDERKTVNLQEILIYYLIIFSKSAVRLQFRPIGA